MFQHLRAINDKIRQPIRLQTHVDFQDENGHLYSVSIFSWEYLHDGFLVGGRFRRAWRTLTHRYTRPFAETSGADLDDCPF